MKNAGTDAGTDIGGGLGHIGLVYPISIIFRPDSFFGGQFLCFFLPLGCF